MEEMRDKHCHFQTMRRCLRTSHNCGGKNCNHRRRSQGNQGVFHQDTEVGLTNGEALRKVHRLVAPSPKKQGMRGRGAWLSMA